MNNGLISTAEAADLLGVTPQRVTQLIRNNQLDGTMIGGRWLVDRASVEVRRSTVSSRGGRPRVGTARDEVAFMLMNRGHEICQVVYNRRRREFVHVGGLLDKSRAPLGVFGQRDVSDAVAFDMWWKGRGIPITRAGLQRILDDAGVFVPEELAMRNLGLSLSDQYWICPQGSQLAWSDINFFNNSFERVSDATAPHSPVLTPAGAHPDNTSDGNLSKRWVVRGGKRLLLKGGGTNNQEPYNEVVATALHQRMLKADEYVPYRLVDDADTTQCACEDFLSDEEEFVPAIYVDRLVPEQSHLSHYQHYVRCCESLGVEDAETALWKTIVCDDIIANSDRHYRNFGVIRNVETLACRPAPIFDSGSCLWADVPLASLKCGEFSFRGKQFDPNPARQLLLVGDMDWFEPGDLDGFGDQAIEILARNPLLSERLPYIKQSLERRIARIVDIREWS